MTNLSSPITAKNKFLIFGGGFSGDYFAKSIRKLGCIALASSRSISNEPNSFIFNSEDNSISGLDFKFYQKLFVILLASCAFLIFPESPQDSEVLCKKYQSTKACMVW